MFKRLSRLTTIPLTLLVFTAAADAAPTGTPTPAHVLLAAVPDLSGPYLGQKPPGEEPIIFAPGIISHPDFTEYSGSFSPDGNEYYFYRFSENSKSRLLFSKVVDGKWTEPEEPAFSAGFAAFEPCVASDNKRLYFAWDHPVPLGHQTGLPAYFFVERKQGGWSEPTYAGQGMFVSSSRDGQLYTTDMSSRNIDGRTYLARVTVDNGVFASYERLPIRGHSGSQAHPCIAPDGSYVVFDVEMGNYLFVSFRNADGTWGEAIDLTEHGFETMAGGAYISPDGKYLFFALGGDIWWVDISVVENLKPTE